MNVSVIKSFDIPAEYSIFIGHAGADFGSQAPFHHYNAATDIAISVATNAEVGQNCTLPDFSENYDANWEVSCNAWRVVLSVVSDGKYNIDCTKATVPMSNFGTKNSLGWNFFYHISCFQR